MRGLLILAIEVLGLGLADGFSPNAARREDVVPDETTRDVAAADGRVVATLFARLWAAPKAEAAEVGILNSLPFITDSRALLALVWRTAGALLSAEGAGLALKAGLFSSSNVSFCWRASRAARSFAATASPGSWKELCVGALVDFGGGGGVGKDMEIGRGLLCGITTSFFSPSEAFSSLVLLVEITRLLAGVGLLEVSRTLLALPSAMDCRGRPNAGSFDEAFLLCAIEMRAAEAFVVRTIGAAFFGGVAAFFGFSGDVCTSGMSLLSFSTASLSTSRATMWSSGLGVGCGDLDGVLLTDTTAFSSSS